MQLGLNPREGNNMTESSAGEAGGQESTPKQAANSETPGTSVLELGGPRILRWPRPQCHFLWHKTVTLLWGEGMIKPQSLLLGVSGRGRCSLHTTLTDSAARSSSRKPPRSPV